MNSVDSEVNSYWERMISWNEFCPYIVSLVTKIRGCRLEVFVWPLNQLWEVAEYKGSLGDSVGTKMLPWQP